MTVPTPSSPKEGHERSAGPASGPAEPFLRVEDLTVRYGSTVTALTNVSLEVAPGSVTAVLGGNGAGKTTLIRAISGVLSRHTGSIVSGDIAFEGRSIARDAPARRTLSGIVQVPEGRHVFGRLTVHENLRVGRFGNPNKKDKQSAEQIYDLFPALADKRSRRAALLSGGEQQMLAIGRALMAAPRLLLLDEPTLGLAPIIIEQIAQMLATIRDEGTTLLLVEQNVNVALGLADRAYVLATGSVALSGDAAELRDDDRVRRLYLGDDSFLEEAP